MTKDYKLPSNNCYGAKLDDPKLKWEGVHCGQTKETRVDLFCDLFISRGWKWVMRPHYDFSFLTESLMLCAPTVDKNTIFKKRHIVRRAGESNGTEREGSFYPKLCKSFTTTWRQVCKEKLENKRYANLSIFREGWTCVRAHVLNTVSVKCQTL